MSNHTIMIVGAGDLGGRVLHEVARTPGVDSLIFAGRNRDYVERKVNLARFAAAQWGLYPQLDSAEFDVDKEAQCVAALKRHKPTLILNTMSLQSWRVIRRENLSHVANMQPDERLRCAIVPCHARGVGKQQECDRANEGCARTQNKGIRHRPATVAQLPADDRHDTDASHDGTREHEERAYAWRTLLAQHRNENWARCVENTPRRAKQCANK